MNETTILEMPARVAPRASSLGRLPLNEPPAAAVDGEREALKSLVMPCVDRLMKRNLTETEIRVAWYVLSCSFAIGRQETGPMTVREVALSCGIGNGKASETLKRLRGMRIIQVSKSGDGLQFMPESDHDHGHHWIAYDRLVDPSRRVMADRMERAHRRRVGEMEFPGWEEPSLDGALADLALEAPAADKPPQRSLGEGGSATGGGGRDFFATRVPESGTSSPVAPLKSFCPPRSLERSLTLNTLKREEVPEKGTLVTGVTLPVVENGGEASMDSEEDRQTTDENVLIRRLTAVIGKEGPDGMKHKGGRWRNFIRGTANAGNDPTSAEGVRNALNELRVRLLRGDSLRSVPGFLWDYALSYANAKGWDRRRAPDGRIFWEQVPKFNPYRNKNAAGGRS